MTTTIKKKKKEKRAHIRFPADKLATAQVDPSDKTTAFHPQHAALILNESYKGCALVGLNFDVSEGDVCKIKLHKLEAMRAVARWRTDLDGSVAVLGFMFLE